MISRTTPARGTRPSPSSTTRTRHPTNGISSILSAYSAGKTPNADRTDFTKAHCTAPHLTALGPEWRLLCPQRHSLGSSKRSIHCSVQSEDFYSAVTTTSNLVVSSKEKSHSKRAIRFIDLRCKAVEYRRWATTLQKRWHFYTNHWTTTEQIEVAAYSRALVELRQRDTKNHAWFFFRAQ